MGAAMFNVGLKTFREHYINGLNKKGFHLFPFLVMFSRKPKGKGKGKGKRKHANEEY